MTNTVAEPFTLPVSVPRFPAFVIRTAEAELIRRLAEF